MDKPISSVTPAVPPTTAAYVVETIRQSILKGHYPLGERLDQKAIAEELGVSLVPVREALRILEGERLVKVYPHRGVFVMEATLDDMVELYRIREALEGLATQLAVPNLTEKSLDELAAIVDGMKQSTASGDYDRLLALNRKFHFVMYAASQQPLLLELIEGLWNRSTLYRRLFTYLPERAAQALQEHQEIFAACQARDPILASQGVCRNIRLTVESLSEEFRRRQVQHSPH